jgi:MFS family permease
MTRSSGHEIITLNAYFFGLAVMWNGLHGLVLPVVLLSLVPEAQKNTYLGLLTFVGLVIAIAVQPISGLLSDRWSSRWGRRRPLIVLGTALDFICLAVLAWAPNLAALAAAAIALQVTSNTAHGPLQGLLPDRVPPERRGMASAVKNLFDMGGLVAGSLLLGRLLPPGTRQPVVAVGAIAAVLAVCALITILGVHETPTAPRGAAGDEDRVAPGQADGPVLAAAPHSALREVPHLLRRVHGTYWWFIASRFAFLVGITGIQGFALYFVRDVLRPANPAETTGDLLAAIVLTLMAVALASGWLVDRLGARRLLLAAAAVAAIGCVLLAAARTTGTLLIFGSIVGAGIGLFLTANWTLANSLAPARDAGLYLGLTNLATAGAGAAARLEGPAIDLLNAARPGAYWGYGLLFAVGAVGALASAALLRGTRGGAKV